MLNETQEQLLERSERSRVCGEGIQELLKLHNCEFDLSITVSAHGNMPDLKVVARPITETA